MKKKLEKETSKLKVLYVVGTNLQANTSANISHNAYIQGLLENGCDVDIIMANASWGQKDDNLPIWEEAKYFIYNSISIIDKFKKIIKHRIDRDSTNSRNVGLDNATETTQSEKKYSIKSYLRKILKLSYNYFFHSSSLYKLEKHWLKNANRFRETNRYDLIISNSSPAASHKLVLDLLSKKHLSDTRWIQIWEDPWYFDLYGGHSEDVRQEEHNLLKAAKEIFYVSILTLHYQKIYFSDCSHKMKHIPLPYLKINDDNEYNEENKCIRFGYFGDYYSTTRNLCPFYEATVESDVTTFINGDSDLKLESTTLVKVQNRVTLDLLRVLQDQTDVLVHLCNLKGGQIPGKIYHYSATNKPILFILDGTDSEKEIIKNYFIKFERYHFCENKKEDILKAIKMFSEKRVNFKEKPVLDFSPKVVINNLLKN